MQYIKESERFFYFSIDDSIPIKVDGVSSNLADATIKFPKKSFRNDRENRFPLCFETPAQCNDWYKIYLESDMKFAPLSKLQKSITVTQKAVSVTDDLWSKMTPHMVSPEEFKKEDFVVFESQLANSAPDRDTERFTANFLKSLMDTIIGKSKLTGHQHGTIGEGVFFDSRIEKYTAEEFLETLGVMPDKSFLSKLKMIEEKEGAIRWGVAKYYMDKTINAEKIRKIQSGAAAPMSIGFSAPQSPYRVDDPKDKEKTLYWEWDNSPEFKAEALEGSDVYLGAQYGARNRKDFGIDVTENEKDLTVNLSKYKHIPAIQELIKEIETGETADESGETAEDKSAESGTNAASDKQDGVIQMKFNLKSLNYEVDVEVAEEQEKAIDSAIQEIDSKVSEIVEDRDDQATKLTTATETIKGFTDVFGETDTLETAKDAHSKMDDYKALREDAENFVLKSMHILGKVKFEDKDDKVKELTEKSITELFDIRKTLTAELAKLKDFSLAQLSNDYEENDHGEKEEKTSEVINESPYTLD